MLIHPWDAATLTNELDGETCKVSGLGIGGTARLPCRPSRDRVYQPRTQRSPNK